MRRLPMLLVLPFALCLGCNDRQRGESPVPPATPNVDTTVNEGTNTGGVGGGRVGSGSMGGTISGPGAPGPASERGGSAAPGTPPDRGENVHGAAGTVGTTRDTAGGHGVVEGPVGQPRTGSERTGTPSTAPAGPRTNEGTSGVGGAYNTPAGSGGVGGVPSGTGGAGGGTGGGGH